MTRFLVLGLGVAARSASEPDRRGYPTASVPERSLEYTRKASADERIDR
jgi:hypothetical protein